ncbi:MAG: hypothetical protein ACKVGZ_09880 [Alphaproteobacteria bacterium]
MADANPAVFDKNHGRIQPARKGIIGGKGSENPEYGVYGNWNSAISGRLASGPVDKHDAANDGADGELDCVFGEPGPDDHQLIALIKNPQSGAGVLIGRRIFALVFRHRSPVS